MTLPPSQNPSGTLNYAPPPSTNLRQVASRQRAIMLCILGYIVAYVLIFVSPPALKIVFALVVLGLQITAAVFVFMLSLSVYNTAVGIVMGILTLIPIVGLIPLLIINGKATRILRAHGVHVGLLGANPKQVPMD
jgi:hypothetical protein